MKVTIPNPNFPSEIDELESIMHNLMDCQVRNRYDMGALDKWLTDKPDAVFDAIQRLRGLMEIMYPPMVVTHVQATEEARKAS